MVHGYKTTLFFVFLALNLAITCTKEEASSHQETSENNNDSNKNSREKDPNNEEKNPEEGVAPLGGEVEKEKNPTPEEQAFYQIAAGGSKSELTKLLANYKKNGTEFTSEVFGKGLLEAAKKGNADNIVVFRKNIGVLSQEDKKISDGDFGKAFEAAAGENAECKPIKAFFPNYKVGETLGGKYYNSRIPKDSFEKGLKTLGKKGDKQSKEAVKFLYSVIKYDIDASTLADILWAANEDMYPTLLTYKKISYFGSEKNLDYYKRVLECLGKEQDKDKYKKIEAAIVKKKGKKVLPAS